ncbi:MAG TPA: LytR C-terminal domain-containing protein [Acidimicrobiales bacterium]
MSATRRHAGEGAAHGASDAAVRGALLIAVAVIIGLLLLWRAHDDDGSTTVSASDGSETVDNTTPDASTPSAPESSTPTGSSAAPPATHAPAEVKVLVANGTGTPNGAGNVTQKLMPKGYATLPAADASTSDVQKSMVFYRGGYAEDAKQIARDLGVPEDVIPTILDVMPAEPPVRGNRGTQSAQVANVLVLLGADQVIKQN